MNKSMLIQEMARRMQVSQRSCVRYLETLIDIMSEELKDGNSLMLQGFGSFTVWPQSERIGRNPRTGVDCTIRARNSVKFKPGKTLIKELNSETVSFQGEPM